MSMSKAVSCVVEKVFPMTTNTVKEEEKVKMPFPIKIYS